ncbi:MAG: outer membrane beta-barrel protein [Bacteroidales bacterium]|nr:outer membrane beta-barrel protein [Candidatus Colicola equi]
MTIRAKIGLLLVALVACFSHAYADERMFHCELGIEGGMGYYIGDAESLPFKNIREMYGANFRYKFTPRWSLQVKGIMHNIRGTYKLGTDFGEPISGNWSNQLVNLDVAAEFNFFRFGMEGYDRRVKPITPYILLGVGVCLHDKFHKIAAYMPFGVGVKWKFAPRWNLQLVWQNNLYFTDKLEAIPELDDRYELNGTNVFNCDITGTIGVGLMFEFAKEKKICRMCQR